MRKPREGASVYFAETRLSPCLPDAPSLLSVHSTRCNQPFGACAVSRFLAISGPMIIYWYHRRGGQDVRRGVAFFGRLCGLKSTGDRLVILQFTDGPQ